jgi:thiol-disulfide isomerase/thioredoxin
VSPVKVLVVTVLAGTLSIGIALFGEHWLAEHDGPSARTTRSEGTRIESLPDLRLDDLSGREVASNGWAGKVVLLNFWATWCAPCRREMPMLERLRQELDPERMLVVGIAIDEPDAVRRYIAEHPVGYPILLGDADTAELSRRLGNRTGGLPFTVVFDRIGRRVLSHVGEVDAELLRTRVMPLLPPETG